MTTVNPRIDIAFKKIFGVEENKDLLISLINAVLDPKDRVADVTLLNPYNPKNFRNAKLSIMDIKAMAAKVRTSLDMWAAFLTRHDLLERRDALPRPLDTPDLKKALDVPEVMNFTDEERDTYENRLKWWRIQVNTLRKYENKGREEGIEKGRELGMEKGREERALEGDRAPRMRA